MIVQVILIIFFGILNFVLSLFMLPSMPTVLLNALNVVTSFITLPISIIKTYVGDAFFVSLLNVVLLLITFNVLIRPGMWLYNKVRGSGS